MKLLSVPYIDQTAAGAFTGCESAAAVMLLRYLGREISLDDFLDRCLDREEFETRDGELWGPDPRRAFAGDPRSADAMGCYAPVIVRALGRALGDGWTAVDETGTPPEVLAKRYLDAGLPVLLWATIDMKPMIPGPCWRLTGSGEVFAWRSNEHCLVLTGYDDEYYYFNDPWQNNGRVRHEKSLVEDRWDSQHRQAAAAVPCRGTAVQP